MASSPPTPFKAKAIAPYQARNDTEASLVVGEIYTVFQTDGKGIWWQTKTNSKPGWFPASYTQVVVENTPPPVVHTPPPPQVNNPTPTPTPQVQTQVHAPTPTPTPQVHTPTPPPQVQTPSTQTEVSSTPRSNASSNDLTVKTIAIQKGNAPSGSLQEEVPQPSKPPIRDKGDAEAYVIVHIVEARGLRPVDGSENKTNPSVYIYRRDVMQRSQVDRPQKIFGTTELKKTVNPNWNERFQINVYDAETEVILVRIGSGKKYAGKNFLGEVQIPLRGAERSKFEQPLYVFKWFPIIGKLDKAPDPQGEIKIYVQFVNTKTFGKPTDVKQVSHIGWSADGGFDIRNIPQEWKKLFSQAGISRKQLEENPELQKEVFNIMQQATEGSTPPTPPVGGGANIPTPPPITNNAPLPPPLPMGGPKAPPPPPMRSTTPTPTPQESGGSSNAQSGDGDSRGGLLAQIQKGTQLKKVDPTAERPPPPSGGGAPNLLSTLQNALMNHRKDIEGDDNDEDDWSNDWDADD